MTAKSERHREAWGLDMIGPSRSISTTPISCVGNSKNRPSVPHAEPCFIKDAGPGDEAGGRRRDHLPRLHADPGQVSQRACHAQRLF